MKKSLLSLFLSVVICSAILASGPGNRSARKLFAAKYSPATENISMQLYKPTRSKNFFTGFGPGTDWTPSGGSTMTYTFSGKISVQIDTSDFFGNTYIRKEMHTYDASDRETEILYQNYDTQTMAWTNATRNVVTYDQQGLVQESRYDQWSNGAWFIYSGFQDVRSYNAQNQLISRLRKSYNSFDSAWVNEGRSLDYQYDAQNRLISYTDQDWNDSLFVNAEKVLLQYGSDNKPNQAILQEWSGTAFDDSVRINEIQWYLWQGNLESGIPLSYIEQRKSAGNWVNNRKEVNSFDGNGSNISLTQIYVSGQWQNYTRSSSIFDDKLNPVFLGNEEYDPGISKWDTLQYASIFLNNYDANGRIQETVEIQLRNAGPDDPDLVWKNVFKRLFFGHQVFTSYLTEMENSFFLSPNPVAAGSSFRMAAGSGLLKLLDMQGRLVFSKTIAENETVSAAGIKPGLYQILFQDNLGKASRSRLIVE